jgi:hypothetical protein
LTYYFNIKSQEFEKGPILPIKILPENPGYTLNSSACFYFLGNLGEIFRFNKQQKSWSKIHINQGESL